MMTVGHRVVRALEAHGVPRVYLVPGESFLEVLDGLHDSPIQTVVARHEGGAGFMALAEGRLTGRPGVVMVTRGPGAANAKIAVHTAWQDGTPLVLFVGMIPLSDRGRGAFQEFDLSDWFGSSAKAVLSLDDPRTAGELVDRALGLSVSGRPGPVVVGLPEDVLLLPAAEGPPAPRGGRSAATPDLKPLLSALLAARRPVVVVGGDQWTQPASDALRSFAERWRIPVVSDYRNHDAIDHDSGSWVGALGIGRGEAAARCYDAADVALYVGAVRSDVLSDGYALGRSTESVFVASADPDLLFHDGPLTQQILADPETLSTALDRLDEPEDPVWAAATYAARDAYLEWSTPRAGGAAGPGVDVSALFAQLAPRTREAVVAYGAGNFTRPAQRYLHAHRVRRLVAPRAGAMGLGLPAAVAAGLARPELRPVVIEGDGCFGMTGMELSTAVRYGVPLVVVLLDNSGYGTIVDHQERAHPGRPSGTSLVNPDFAALARAHGAHGERVTADEQIAGALDRAFASPIASLVHVVTAAVPES